jgi:hypothetical protein
MDNCFEPGRIIILPFVGGPKEVLLPSGEDQQPEVIATVDDYLNYYGIPAMGFQEENEPRRERGSPSGRPFLLRVPVGQELEAAEHFRGQRNVRASSPNFYVNAVQSGVTIQHAAITDAIRRLNAMATAPGCGEGVRVAILDTGLDPKLHPPELPKGRAFPVEQYDIDKPRKPTSLRDPVGHGTLVACIIRQIAPAVAILPVKVMEDTGTVWSVVCGLFVAEARYRPDIYNLSLQVKCDVKRCAFCKRGPSILPAHLELLFSSFLPSGESGRPAPLIVAAAGNNARQIQIPAIFPDVLAVGAYNVTNYSTPDYSMYESVPAARFILAPGGLKQRDQCFAIKPSEPCQHLETFFYGTSFSAAYVSGIAARYLCAALGGGCSVPQPVPLPPSTWGREFILDCLAASADRSFTGFTPLRHGLGVVRYDCNIAQDTLAKWYAGGANERRQLFVSFHREELLSAVSGKAFELYESEGRPEGRAVAHWQRAKAVLGLADVGSI